MPRLQEAVETLQKDLRVMREETQTDIRSLREGMQTEIRTLREEIHTEIRNLDAKVDSLREDMLDKFGQARDVANEISHRVTRLDGKLEGYTEAMGFRLQLDEAKLPKRRRAS